MQSKTFALLALSASSVLASPFHKRADIHRHRHHGTGTGSHPRPTGSGSPFPAGNDTNGLFAPTGNSNPELATLIVTQTVRPLPLESGDLPATFGNVVADASTSCVTTSVATETSTNFVTITAATAGLANTKVVEVNSVSAGAFYAGQGSRSYGGGWGQGATSAAASVRPSTTFATAVVPAGSAAAASSAVASIAANTPSTGSSGGKRGISFNDASLVSAFSGAVSWTYDWGVASTKNAALGSIDYFPMMWGKNDVSSFASKVGSATHVLSFNEPDLAEQANIDPQTAATLHKQGMASLIGKVEIGSPAVTNGATTSPPMGVNWLDQFLTACAGQCGITAVAYHWYATADSFEYFKQHTDDIVAVAAKYGINKVWLTEFKPEGSADAQAAFMKLAVPYLDSNPAVEKYAAFMASDGTLLSGKSLNAVGKAYAGL